MCLRDFRVASINIHYVLFVAACDFMVEHRSDPDRDSDVGRHI